MHDFNPILTNVSRFISLTQEEEAIFISLLRIVRVRKKQFIVQPDFVCQYRTYVVKGALQAYSVGHDGQEHTLALAIDDWWISDFTSYINQDSRKVHGGGRPTGLCHVTELADEESHEDA